MDTRSKDHIVRTHDGGFVLPIMVFALLMLGVMGAASLQSSRDELLSAAAVNSSNLAFYAAEAGIHNAMASWDAWNIDTLVANPGDSLVESWTTLENGCDYQVVYRRVDGGDLASDKLYLVESTGQSPGLNGGKRRVGMMVKERKWFNSAITVGGDMKLEGNPTIAGGCSDIHSNGHFMISGTTTLDGNASATDSASVPGVLLSQLGDTLTATEGTPEKEIPDLDPMDYCDEADYIFENGWGTEVATGTNRNLIASWWGWKYSSGMYVTDNNSVMPGVYCMDSDAQLNHQIGTAANPLAITILSVGTVTIPGDPYMVPAHSDSLLIIAEGDVMVNGNPVAGEITFEGLIYAGAQCEISGNPVIYGQVVCRDDPNPPGSLELASENLVSGNMQLTYTCGGLMAHRPPWPIGERMWNHVW